MSLSPNVLVQLSLFIDLPWMRSYVHSMTQKQVSRFISRINNSSDQSEVGVKSPAANTRRHSELQCKFSECTVTIRTVTFMVTLQDMSDDMMTWCYTHLPTVLHHLYNITALTS